MTRSRLILIALALVCLQFAGGGGILASPTRATYVFERRGNSVPAPVAAAIDKLNRKGITANSADQNETNGKGEVPAQYVVAFAEAKKVGIPCLVVEFTRGAPMTVKDPKTEAEVLEAAR